MCINRFGLLCVVDILILTPYIISSCFAEKRDRISLLFTILSSITFFSLFAFLFYSEKTNNWWLHLKKKAHKEHKTNQKWGGKYGKAQCCINLFYRSDAISIKFAAELTDCNHCKGVNHVWKLQIILYNIMLISLFLYYLCRASTQGLGDWWWFWYIKIICYLVTDYLLVYYVCSNLLNCGSIF